MGRVGGSYSWNAICDICGFKYKAHELRRRWDGYMVCDKDFETRHPMDFYRVKSDAHPLPFTRPEAGVTQAGILSSDFVPAVPSVSSPDATVGNLLTAEQDIIITGLRVWAGDDASNYPPRAVRLGLWTTGLLWSGSGMLVPNRWNFFPITPHQTITAATQFTVGAYAQASTISWDSMAAPDATSLVSWNESTYLLSSFGKPTNTSSAFVVWLVDVVAKSAS